MIKKIVFFILFLMTIPCAGYAIEHIGTCVTGHPCLIPVWFYPIVYAPSGVLFAGSAFVFRDILQRVTNLKVSLIAVCIGTILNYILVDKNIAMAGAMAYLLSESTDTIVYSTLQKYSLTIAVLVSAICGLIVDTVVFLHIAFHSLEYSAGQIIGKLWMVLISIPIIRLCRRYI